MCLGGGVQAKYLLPCCCIRDSLTFDIVQHDVVLKKRNFDLLNPRVRRGLRPKIFAIILLHFVLPIYLICNMTMF